MSRPVGAAGRRRGGFTLVEILLVMVILSILAGLALPRLQRAILKARAADAIGDLDVIRVAVLQYQAEHNAWPADVNRGRIPSGLEEFLPEGFSFQHDDFVLDYDNWSAQKNGFVGVTVITDESELEEAMLALLGDTGTWTDGATRFSWIIEWS